MLVAFLMLVSGLFLHAQEYRGTIYGVIADPSGAVIPSAVVTAAGPQQTYHAKTNRKGEFTIPFVELGVYSVSANAPGFGVETKNDIHIDVDSKISINFVMKVGSTAETVTVEANDVSLNTVDASGGTVLAPEMVQNLPLNGRQVYMMLALTPGTKFTATVGPNGDSGTRGWDETNAYSINGQSGNYNQMTLNGAPISQQGGGGAGTWNISPSIDAVDEFKVMTNTYDASYGRATGGSVNTVLKSGGNKYHGTAYDFWKNTVLDANLYQNKQVASSLTPRSPHNEHQFGGTIGGPVIKQKTFFFFSYEGYRQVLPASSVASTVTPDMLPGYNGSPDVNATNFMASRGETNGLYDPLTTTCVSPQTDGTCNQYGRTAFANNIIPANRLSAIGVAIMKLYPAPNRTGYTNNYIVDTPGHYQYNMPIGRIDQVFSDNTRMYAMFAWWAGTENRNGNGMPGVLAQGNINNYRSSLTQVLDLTHNFSRSITSDARLSFNRAWNESPDGASAGGGYPDFTAKTLGLNMPQIPTTPHQYPPEIGNWDCCIANIFGNTESPSLFETYDLGFSLMQVVKKHNLHYGVEGMLFHDIPTGVGQPNGFFNFSAAFDQNNPFQGNNDGDSMSAILLGYPDGNGIGGGSAVQDWESVYESYNYYSAFLQDDWKILPKLTLNLGLRWETEDSPRERNNRLSAGVCLTCVNPVSSLINSSAVPSLPLGASFPNPMVGGFQFASSNYSAYQNYFGTLLPKFGFSYALNNHLVLRGGYGMSTALGIELGAQSTWEQNTSYVASHNNGIAPALDCKDSNQNPVGCFIAGTPYPNGVTAPEGNSKGLMTGVGDGQSFDQRNREIPRSEAYSFGFQGQAPLGIIWDTEYVGTHTYRLRAGIQLDSLTPAEFAAGTANPGLLQQQVTNPFVGAVPVTSGLGSSPTVQAASLMTPYPQFQGLYNYADPQGYSHYDSLIAKAEKRLSGQGGLAKGLSFLAAFTWSKNENATGRLNNGNLVDPKPYKAVDGSDRLWDFAFSGLYGLPVGRGSAVLATAHGFLGEVVNDWQLEWIFQNDGGTPVSYPNGDLFGGAHVPASNNCTAANYNIVSPHRNNASYLNNTESNCFAGFPSYTATTRLPITEAVRNPWTQQTTLGMEKHFKVTETTKLQFKAEAFNATNTAQFGLNGGDPKTPPQLTNNGITNPNQPGYWTGYGTVSSNQQNFPRQFQFALKLLY
jgi:hypothetical protein